MSELWQLLMRLAKAETDVDLVLSSSAQ